MSFIKFENVGSFLRHCNGTTLRYDQACLEIDTEHPISFWNQYEECEGCVLLKTAHLPSTGSIVLSTLSPARYAIKNGAEEICNGTFQFREFGQYSINLTEKGNKCSPQMTAEPDEASLPILTAVVILLSMATLWYIVKGIGKRVIAGRLYARYFAR